MEPEDFGPQQDRYEAWVWFGGTDVCVIGTHFAADPAVGAPAGWRIEEAHSIDGDVTPAICTRTTTRWTALRPRLENSRWGLFS